MANIRIDTDGLQNNISSMRAYVNELDSLNARTQSLLAQIASSWEGEASTAYINIMTERMQKAGQMKELLQEFLSYMEEEGCTPSLSQAQKLKAASKESVLTKDTIHEIMSARSPSVKPREPQLTIAVSKVERYFPKGFSSEQMESTILKLLENYYRKRQDYER